MSVEASGLIFNTVYALTFNPAAAKSYWMGADFSNLLQYDRGYFFVQTFFLIIVAVLKALMFDRIIRNLHNSGYLDVYGRCLTGDRTDF